MYVMVVENDVALRKRLNGALETAQIPASFAAGRAEALRIAREVGAPGMLVVNVDLGERLDGYNLAHELRLLTPDMPTLFLSPTRWDVVRGIIGKRDDFVQTPFEDDAFMKKLWAILPSALHSAAQRPPS